MKKIKTSIMAMTAAAMLLMGGSAFADSADSYAAGAAGSSYNAGGTYFSTGGANTTVPNGFELDTTFDTGKTSVSIAASGQKVNSDAWTLSDSTKGDVSNAFGTAYQDSNVYAAESGGNNASAGQWSAAGYDVTDKSSIFSRVNGNAKTIGGSVAFVTVDNTGRFQGSDAFAATGSMGKAETNGGPYNKSTTFAEGAGSAVQNTNTNAFGASAGSSSLASYSYDNVDYDAGTYCNTYNAERGAGFATVTGKTDVSKTRYGISASTNSTAYSTGGGQADTTGGTYVNTGL